MDVTHSFNEYICGYITLGIHIYVKSKYLQNYIPHTNNILFWLETNNKMPRQNESGSRRALPESCLRSPNTRGTSEEHLS
jgi:hypothetical protein